MVIEFTLPDLDLKTDRHVVNGPSQPCLQQQTPPTSDIGSPDTGTDGSNIDSQALVARLPCRSSSPVHGTSMRLPGLEAFDRGVEALARFDTRRSDRSLKGLLPSPIPRARKEVQPLLPPRLLWSPWNLPDEPSSPERSASPPETAIGLGISYPTKSHGCDVFYGNRSFSFTGRRSVSHFTRPTKSCLRSPSSDERNSHGNQQYSVEEGDFIIYARHDKRFKWSRVEQEFAALFGQTPKRSAQGLQAWHYRMNNHIPVWDEDGWLCFDSEDSEKPSQTDIKSHRLSNHGQSSELLGLAQRYPERAVTYTWVDAETKKQAKDWAAKRSLQLEFRDRRRRKRLARALAEQPHN